MTVNLNEQAFEHAKNLIMQGRFVYDERDAWSEHQPSTAVENHFIAEHGFDEYAHWYLGVDSEAGEATKSRYKFPYGDFQKAHRCSLLAAFEGADAHHQSEKDPLNVEQGK